MTFEELTKERRSINFFDPDKDVAPKDLEKIVGIAANTPSGFNLQPWNLIVLRDKEEKEKLKKLAWDQPKVVEAPVTLIVLADRDGFREGHSGFERTWKQMVEKEGMPEGQRDWFINAAASLYDWSPEADLAFAAKNTGFFAMSLMYAAKSLGIDSHPMDGFDHNAVKEAFNIPDRYWVLMLLALGYKKPGLELRPPKWRKNYGDIVVSF